MLEVCHCEAMGDDLSVFSDVFLPSTLLELIKGFLNMGPFEVFSCPSRQTNAKVRVRAYFLALMHYIFDLQ